MKVKSEITVTNKSGAFTLKFDGKGKVTSCMGFNVLRRQPLDVCVGDYVEHDGVLCRVIKSNSEEYEEIDPDSAKRESVAETLTREAL